MKKSFFSTDTPKSDRAAEKPLVPSKGGDALSEHVEKYDPKLGIWDRIKLNKMSSEQIAGKLGEITVAMVTKQRDEIYQKLMLDLDVNKKKAFIAYMERVGFLNEDLVNSSSEMERSLRSILQDEIRKIYEEKRRWEAMIKDLKLSDVDQENEIERMNNWIEIAKGQIDAKVTILKQNGAKALEETMKLLIDSAIKGNSAMN